MLNSRQISAAKRRKEEPANHKFTPPWCRENSRRPPDFSGDDFLLSANMSEFAAGHYHSQTSAPPRSFVVMKMSSQMAQMKTCCSHCGKKHCWKVSSQLQNDERIVKDQCSSCSPQARLKTKLKMTRRPWLIADKTKPPPKEKQTKNIMVNNFSQALLRNHPEISNHEKVPEWAWRWLKMTLLLRQTANILYKMLSN